MGHPMRLELTRAGLLVELANHYATQGALASPAVSCVSGSSNLDSFRDIYIFTGTLAQRLECSPMALGDLGSIPGRVIPKTLKMELDTTLLNTQHYKVRFKGKVEQSREWSSALPYTLV